MSMPYQLRIIYNSSDFAISDLTNKSWEKADAVVVKKYWSGKTAPTGRHFTARLLWSRSALYLRFEANQAEPLIVTDKPDLTKKTMNLWDRDVCEIFVAPDVNEPRKYFEFEIAPTGEWVDVALDATVGERKSDLEYKSGMESAVNVKENKIMMAIKIDWKAFGKTPKAGDVWLGNIFRCIGKDPYRGYMAWSPTMTKNPNFHVHEKFGKLVFQK